jgi:secreted trypsin-like serine protease
VTAAHCFQNDEGNAVDASSASRTFVTLASDTLDPPGSAAEIYAVSALIVHPDYDPDPETSSNPNDFDIALLRLNGQSSLSVARLQAANEAVPEGVEAIIMGWGATAVDDDNTSTDPSNRLLESTQRIASNETCNAVYGGAITDNMICASAPPENSTTDTCQGDSGGPLLVSSNGEFVQVGIVSFGGTETGPVCGDPEAPGVYARVSAFNGFIAAQIPELDFVALDESTANCAGTTIDNSTLNLTIACVVLDGTVFSTGLSLVGGDLKWQWNGEINPSSCVASDSRCVAPDENLGLIMTGIPYAGESNTLILELDQNSGPELQWSYQQHFVE